ncbi:hypothetical protein [Streptomyces profundus]|uniref:hypothetical protein n=1 Tax=Streptomyces profundus TaxID=2867410 RepID=UPI001D169563|nr:hypothetical protein [Streptomyces sp. MA3_2.13]UED86084.1 hypothetical protein K4G22_19375 [Streptomyces sp. MA3_2.13]
MGITRSLPLTLCAAAALAATFGVTPAGAADGRPTDGGAVLVTPVAPLPGEEVRLRVPDCAGDSGTAVSVAFAAEVRLSPTGTGGGLYGETLISSTTPPGDHPVQVTCGHPDGELMGLVTVGGGEPTTWADNVGGGGGAPLLARPASTADPAEPADPAVPESAGTFGDHGEGHGDPCRREGRAPHPPEPPKRPGHEKPEKPGHEKPGHERPERPEKPEHERCEREGGGHHPGGPTGPVRAGGGGTAGAEPLTAGAFNPAGLAVLAGGGAAIALAVRRLRSRVRASG